MTTRHTTRKKPRQRVLCATPSCENRIAVSQDDLFPVYCEECRSRQRQQREE